jgi:NADH dehydrogenase (ubiquinone) 1 alpha subcomplex subunit 1
MESLIKFAPHKTNWILTQRRSTIGRKEKTKMSLVWLEAMLPLGIIGGMLCIMGNSQYYIHKAYHGRPKHIGHDEWDVAMERRDKKVVEKAAAPSS